MTGNRQPQMKSQMHKGDTVENYYYPAHFHQWQNREKKHSWISIDLRDKPILHRRENESFSVYRKGS